MATNKTLKPMQQSPGVRVEEGPWKGPSLTQQELKLSRLYLALGKTASTLYLGSASKQTTWKLLYNTRQIE